MNNNKKRISRRDFIRYSAIGLTVSAIPVTSGCTRLMQPNKSEDSCQSQNLKSNVRYKNIVFEPSSLSKIKLNNRIIKAATALNLPADNGKPTSQLADTFVEICKGGVGAIITGGVAVQQNGSSAFENALLIDKDENINAYQKIASGVAGDGFSTIRVHEFPTDMLLEYNFAYKDLSPTLKTLTKYGMPLFSWMYKYEPVYNYNVCAAQKIKNAVSIPVIVVGGIRKLNDIEQIIGRNMADYVSMARPFIIEPDIVNKFKAESQISSECLECGHCILALEELPVECFYGEVP